MFRASLLAVFSFIVCTPIAVLVIALIMGIGGRALHEIFGYDDTCRDWLAPCSLTIFVGGLAFGVFGAVTAYRQDIDRQNYVPAPPHAPPIPPPAPRRCNQCMKIIHPQAKICPYCQTRFSPP